MQNYLIILNGIRFVGFSPCALLQDLSFYTDLCCFTFVISLANAHCKHAICTIVYIIIMRFVVVACIKKTAVASRPSAIFISGEPLLHRDDILDNLPRKNVPRNRRHERHAARHLTARGAVPLCPRRANAAGFTADRTILCRLDRLLARVDDLEARDSALLEFLFASRAQAGRRKSCRCPKPPAAWDRACCQRPCS